jgi:predicted  nucleic acid-binding Zn-ribbon protein
VHVEAHKTATFTAAQRRLLARRKEVRTQKLEQLRRWLHDRILDQDAFDALQKVLALYDHINELEAKLKETEGRRKQIYDQQKVIQGNLGALRDQGEEAELRARYVQALNQHEDQLAQLKADDDENRKAIEQTQKEIEALLAKF